MIAEENKKVVEEVINNINKMVEDQIIERSNADLLIKMINRADTLTEVLAIQELGLSYKRTGFHFDKRLEKTTDTIHYLKKNENLSFDNGGIKHKLIIGDNYHALQNLLIQYKEQIDVIYIDPPYGKDDMGSFAQTNYNNDITRDNLLSMLYPRLVLAKQLLKPEGVLFCSIDDKNQAYAKCLFDTIFGENNFAGAFPWRKRTAKSDVPFGISQDYEYILIYARSETFLASTEGPGRKYYETDDFPGMPWRFHDLTTQRTIEERPNSNYTMVNPRNGEQFPVNPLRCWAITIDTFQSYYNNHRVIFPGDYDFLNIKKPVLRYWKKDDEEKSGENFGKIAVSTKLPDTVGMSQDGTKELTSIFGDKVFNYPKPSSLIKYLLSISSGPESIILDFFAGTGTTGQAVAELNIEKDENRKFILCTNNEVTDKNPNGIAYDVTSKRLKRVITGECYNGTSDFAWLEKNSPLGGSLEVTEIAEVPNFENEPEKSAFDVIDETLYGQEKFDNINDKIAWICKNFDNVQKELENA